MKKKVIAIQTDGPMRKSGLGRNGKALAKYLYNTGKYEIVYFAQQGYSYNDPELKKLPFRAYGGLPDNQAELMAIQGDPVAFRDATYGSLCIDRFIRDVRPFAMIFSNDSWAFPYYSKPWWNKFHCLPHITLDSTPFQNEQIEFIKKSNTHYVWAKFAQEESERLGLKNVKTIPALIEESNFFNLGAETKAKLRKKHNISQDCFVIGFVFRNQVRKEIKPLLEGFKKFKTEYPLINAKLLLHTNFTEGWNIFAFLEELQIPVNDILTTYFCKNCGQYEIKSPREHTPDCKFCGGKKTQFYCGIQGGVSEEQLNEVYNIMDCYIHPANAGGCEMPIVEALYAELPVATVSYAFGKTFTDEPFCYSIKNYWTVQHGTQFNRAVPCPDSIKDILKSIYFSKDRASVGKQGREFALKHFSSSAVGKLWEEALDSLPEVVWDYDFSPKKKNPNYPMPPNHVKDDDFITLLYDNVLLQHEPKNGDGHQHWLKQLKAGIPREKIYEYFVSVAINDNQKNENFTIFKYFSENPNRALFFVDGNSDDCFLTTSLISSFKDLHPDYDVYVSCSQEQQNIFKGNPDVHKILPLLQEFGDPILMKGILNGEKIVDYLFIPNLQTSKIPLRIGGADETINL